uniref:Uncharacterized protein n=1 Tax=Arundo donax TaxID=35708 RepID=A0A0A9C131_ARUDO
MCAPSCLGHYRFSRLTAVNSDTRLRDTAVLSTIFLCILLK